MTRATLLSFGVSFTRGDDWKHRIGSINEMENALGGTRDPQINLSLPDPALTPLALRPLPARLAYTLLVRTLPVAAHITALLLSIRMPLSAPHYR